MKKKLIALTLLAAVMLCGCTARDSAATAPETTPVTTVPEATVHPHPASEMYSWNDTEHWRDCECGEKVELAPHNIGDDMLCVDCGLEVWELDDGYVDVTSYDEYGNPMLMISYDPDGNTLASTEYKYSYDDQGNIMRCEYFYDGVLQSLEEYLMTEDGSTRVFSCSMFNEGEIDYNEYDENGNIIYAVHYNADKVVTHESWSEYAMDDNGEHYECKAVSVYEDGTKIEAEYNQYAETTLRRS